MEKTLGNTDAAGAKENVKDIKFFGDGDTFKLISKASSQNEGWMKSTKAMEIENAGCVVQVSTQQGQNVAEALTFVPDVYIQEILDDSGLVTGRRLVKKPNPFAAAFVKNLFDTVLKSEDSKDAAKQDEHPSGTIPDPNFHTKAYEDIPTCPTPTPKPINPEG